MNSEFDHRSLGQKYDLFSFFEEAPGFPFYKERGLRIRNALINQWREVHRVNGYQEVQSPIMMKQQLWEKSGHLGYFKENMYLLEDLAVKPMSCPGAILFYSEKRRSFRELPMRLCELGHVHRKEESGALSGLFRARSFVQDDAHIFCRRDQLFQEVVSVISLIKDLFARCGFFELKIHLSVRGAGKKKYLGRDEDWLMAEEALAQSVRHSQLDFILDEGEAKFYGPSLDFHLKDNHDRSWQCSSIQLDFNLPERFGLSYVNEEQIEEVPLLIHRAIYGSLERFMAILLEHYGKELPQWLHPVEVKVISIAKEYNGEAMEVASFLARSGRKIELDLSEHPLKEKVKRCHGDLVASVCVIGEKEVQSGRASISPLKSSKSSGAEVIQWRVKEPNFHI